MPHMDPVELEAHQDRQGRVREPRRALRVTPRGEEAQEAMRREVAARMTDDPLSIWHDLDAEDRYWLRRVCEGHCPEIAQDAS